jgi:hypothetical protein
MNLSVRNKFLEKAKMHIFSTGVNDGAANLCRENTKYGLAKIHFVQEKYGFDPNATFISSPDETITRNVSRWEQGISYGGKISWGSGNDKLVILDTKPNTCGMLVGGLEKVPEPKQIVKNMYALEHEDDFINDVRVKWDLDKGNHFVEIYEVDNHLAKNLPRYVVFIHAGCPELKEDVDDHFGLYFNESEKLNEICDKVETPFGICHVLEGNDAAEYLKFYKFAENFSKKRREIALMKIFGSKKVICNHCHQGLVNMNEIRLGCHHIENERELFPVSIKADTPSYLMTGIKNFTKDHIEDLGFKERAIHLGVYNRLRNINILPHGGGYKLPDVLHVDDVFEVKDKRFFYIDMVEGMSKKIISNPHDLEYDYRGREVLLKTLELGLGKIFAKLNPIYDLKL